TSANNEKKYTPEQIKAVKAILACGTDYYKVLSLDKKCTEVEIKKSYRKLALQFHPDKNSAPGADEAFKLISKAFTVLSDPQKRVIHDAGGGDPEQRGNAGAAGFSGFRSYQHPGFGGEDISPEDLFNMFFGGGGGSGMMGGGFNGGFPGFSSATFVGPGFRTHTFHTGAGAGRRAPPQAQQQRQGEGSHSRWAILLQLLPLLILFGYSVISGLMTDNTPMFSFQPTSIYSQPRITETHNIPYYVNPKTFRSTEQNKYKLSRVEQQVTMDWVRGLQHSCQAERKERSAKIRSASGVFGIGRDEKRYQEALSWPTQSCDKLTRIG
ncbi:DnaJ domain-containing protein, partial [Halteromyces radiatus]|uniref:DnaJ domain-containing protein n=1 Tax=Halteromyces radiatus TaxID=101107 RepID=UPI002220EAE8